MTAEILPWAGHQLTLADWEAMPEDERFRFELVEGVVVDHAEPTVLASARRHEPHVPGR